MTSEIYREGRLGVSITEEKEIDALLEMALKSPNKRAMMTLHRTQNEKLLRIIYGMWPETYVRPYKHSYQTRLEWLHPLKGIAELLTFDEDGGIRKRTLLKHGMIVEVEADTWRMFIARGPFALSELIYQPGADEDERGKDKIFAPWAPQEGTKEGEEYLESLRRELDLVEAS